VRTLSPERSWQFAIICLYCNSSCQDRRLCLAYVIQMESDGPFFVPRRWNATLLYFATTAKGKPARRASCEVRPIAGRSSTRRPPRRRASFSRAAFDRRNTRTRTAETARRDPASAASIPTTRHAERINPAPGPPGHETPRDARGGGDGPLGSSTQAVALCGGPDDFGAADALAQARVRDTLAAAGGEARSSPSTRAAGSSV